MKYEPVVHKNNILSRVGWEEGLQEILCFHKNFHEYLSTISPDSFQELFMPGNAGRLETVDQDDLVALLRAYHRLDNIQSYHMLRGFCAGDAELSMAMVPRLDKIVLELLKEEKKRQQAEKELQEAGAIGDNEKKAQAEAKLEQIEQQSRQTQARAVQTLAQMAKDAQNAKQIGAAWGLEPSQLMQFDDQRPAVDMALLARLLEQLGSLNFGGKIVGEEKVHVRLPVGIEQGADLSRVLPSEYALLNTALEPLFWARFVDKSLLQYSEDLETIQVRSKQGPLVVLIDESSSMKNNQIRVAHALALATQIISEKAKRHCVVVAFATNVRLTEKIDMKFYQTRFNGGTDYLLALQKAIERKREDEALDDADVLMITDGVWGGNIEELVLRIKEFGGKLHTFICNNAGNESKKFLEVCNSVWTVSCDSSVQISQRK